LREDYRFSVSTIKKRSDNLWSTLFPPRSARHSGRCQQ